MLLKINPDNPEKRKIKQITECLLDGGVVIYPTDTVYGFGCNIFKQKAIERICQIKGINPKKSHFSFVCTDLSNISDYTLPYSSSTFKLMKKTLPGAFTYILKANSNIPKLFKNNKKTVGIRIPDNNIARTIVEELGQPILSSSISSDPDLDNYPNDPFEIHERFKKLVDIVIDGGIGNQLPSTVVDCTKNEIEILRQGAGDLEPYL